MPYKLVKIKSCNGKISDSDTTYKIHSILYQNIDINDLLTNISDIYHSGDLFYGKYELPMIVDEIKKPETKDKFKTIPKKTIPEIKILQKVFCVIYSETSIRNNKRYLYPFYFLADLIGKIPDYYKSFSLLDEDVNKDKNLIIVPNSEALFINDNTTLTQPIKIDYCTTYKFNCYFKDKRFIDEIKTKDISEETHFGISKLYKYFNIFQLELADLKLAKDIIIDHFTDKSKFENINEENIFIMIKHNNTYLNHVYLSVYIIDPNAINYVNFDEFNANIKLDYWIHIMENPSDHDKLSYIIDTDAEFAENNISGPKYIYNVGSNESKKDKLEEFVRNPLIKEKFKNRLFKLEDKEISSIKVLNCKFLKNKYHNYCDKHYLLEITTTDDYIQKYRLSFMSKLLGKYIDGREIDDSDSLIESIKSIDPDKRITHKISDTINQHYFKISSDIEIYCEKYIENVDFIKKSDENPIAEPIANPIAKSIANPITKSNNLDITLLVTLGFIRYYIDNRATIQSDDNYRKIIKILKQIPLIFSNIACVLEGEFYNTENFILFSRTGLAISNDLNNAYKNKEKITCKLIKENGYYILWNVPRLMGDRIKASLSNFVSVIEEIKKIHDMEISAMQIAKLSNIELNLLLRNIRSKININMIIQTIIGEIFDIKTIYDDKLNHPLNYITPDLKLEIDRLVFENSNIKFTDVVISHKIEKEFKIFHMHCIADYSSYRDRFAKYLMIPSKKKSYITIRDIDFRNKDTNFL